jgi:capsular polysaccharide biosynthesis protein
MVVDVQITPIEKKSKDPISPNAKRNLNCGFGVSVKSSESSKISVFQPKFVRFWPK